MRSGTDTRAAGFTLLEMMVTLAIVALSVSVFIVRGGNLLPQSQLVATTKQVATDLEEMRLHSVLTQKATQFVYHLDPVDDEILSAYSAGFPFRIDEDGEYDGIGETELIAWTHLARGMRIRTIRVPGTEDRETGDVTVSISPLGAVTPHEVVIENPEYPETEVYTIQVNGVLLTNTVVEGDIERPRIEDGAFR